MEWEAGLLLSAVRNQGFDIDQGLAQIPSQGGLWADIPTAASWNQPLPEAAQASLWGLPAEIPIKPTLSSPPCVKFCSLPFLLLHRCWSRGSWGHPADQRAGARAGQKRSD